VPNRRFYKFLGKSAKSLKKVFQSAETKEIGRLVGAILLVVIISSCILVFVPKKIHAEKVKVVFEKGESSIQIANQLEKAGLINSRYLFLAYALADGKLDRLEAGLYLLSPAMTVPELVNIIGNGLTTTEDITVTFFEGDNIAEMGKRLENADLIKAADFVTPETMADEGYLFPDTYIISKGKSEGREAAYTQEIVSQVLEKMKDNFNKQIALNFPNLIGPDGKIKDPAKLKNAVIVASMLEKEVRSEKDMRLVAGIIKKRLALGMKLELDATVAYGVCFGPALAPKSQNVEALIAPVKTSVPVLAYCDVSQADIVDNLKVDSLYNSYTRKGLPTGPISNPGLQAISAALNPLPSQYLYYLSAKDGTTIYAKTGAEQERNRVKYLK
jgi:UPF0755 protein